MVGEKEKRREKEEKERKKEKEETRRPVGSVGHCRGGCLVRRPSFEGATVFPPFPSSRPFPTRHLCPFLLSEGERGTFPWGGLARVCHSVMDDSTPTRSIRLPCVYMPRGEGETHPPAFLPPLCRESRRFRPI